MSDPSQKFVISVGEPWDFEGPDGANRIEVVLEGQVQGPDVENWADSYLLLKIKKPFKLDGHLYSHLVAAPRYTGDTIDTIISIGGVVGVSGLLINASMLQDRRLAIEDVRYIIIGELVRTKRKCTHDV